MSYVIKCHRNYIRQASQTLRSRINLHHPERCALAEQVNTKDHVMRFDETTILKSEKNHNKRNILEINYIIKNNCLSYRTDTQNLNVMYKNNR